jgi:3-deoxy-manno-octulosonate cytidylyltransferase (CMP-KDO synthetase)
LNSKIIDRVALKEIVDRLKADGKKVVFTNGCFDILHVGHLRYLQHARGLGECLVIGLNTDEAVRNLKGSERPFVPENERAEMMAGLECVDYVVIFKEPTPIEILGELKPDIHVKGGDYVLSQIPEARFVQEYGGEVVIVPQIAGKSTSRLVSHVRSVASTGALGRDKKSRVVGIIPARLASTRLPNKPLLDIAGKPLIQRVYERAKSVKSLDEVVVATPDPEIASCVEGFGGKAVITSPMHPTGTDRLAEAARTIESDVVVNIQGDEPLFDPNAVNALVKMMLDSADADMGSLMTPTSPGEENDPSVVKVVTDKQGFALYFSRSVIPFPRNGESAVYRKHVGIYAYRRNFLIILGSIKQSSLETSESLEQLRVLENGYGIRMVEIPSGSEASVDTPEDLERVRAILS